MPIGGIPTKLEIIEAYDRPETIRALFSEYTQLLVDSDPSFRAYLELQHYDREFLHPEEKYALPNGRLYLALCDGIPAGCIALRPLDGARCEMKRLYVRPAFRGQKIGLKLVERILSDARAIGCRKIFLDALPCLENALCLYRSLGFYEIPAYNDSPVDASVFLCLDL